MDVRAHFQHMPPFSGAGGLVLAQAERTLSLDFGFCALGVKLSRFLCRCHCCCKILRYEVKPAAPLGKY